MEKERKIYSGTETRIWWEMCHQNLKQIHNFMNENTPARPQGEVTMFWKHNLDQSWSAYSCKTWSIQVEDWMLFLKRCSFPLLYLPLAGTLWRAHFNYLTSWRQSKKVSRNLLEHARTVAYFEGNLIKPRRKGFAKSCEICICWICIQKVCLRLPQRQDQSGFI